MSINHVDSTHALFLRESPLSEDEADDVEDAPTAEELRRRAKALTRAGRFKYLERCRWAAGDWTLLEVLP